MLVGEILSVLMFVALVAALMLGYPVAFTLAGVAFAFALIGDAFGTFDLTYFSAMPLRFWGIITNEVLIAVPLFVFMGVMLERSRIAETLLTTMGQLFGNLRGGLGISAILVATLLAASTGIVGATVVTMGLISLPTMLAAGYSKRLATGLICASGTLGQIVPPSTVLVFVAVILQSIYSQVQMTKGNFAPDTLSVGDLFAGAFIPGLLLSGLYMACVVVYAVLWPQTCPPLKMSAAERKGLGRRVVIALIPPLLLIVAVLGSILAGVATPTESASVGAIGAALLTLVKIVSERYAEAGRSEDVERKLFWFWIGLIAALCVMGALFGALGLLTASGIVFLGGLGLALSSSRTRLATLKIIAEVSRTTVVITAMVFVIFLGATVFSLVFSRMGGEQLVEDFLTAMPGGSHGALFVVMLIMFLLGFFLDTFEIIFIVVPLASPVLFQLDVDPIWLSILIGVNLQTSFLTPPFGFSLFYLRGVAPSTVTTQDIYVGIVPFVGIQILCLAAVWFFPPLATWLPKLVYG